MDLDNGKIVVIGDESLAEGTIDVRRDENRDDMQGLE
jgi:hypothetical protein